MYITHVNIFVNDQNKALQFYTNTLGFLKKEDMSVDEFKWLTVVSSNNLNGVELSISRAK